MRIKNILSYLLLVLILGFSQCKSNKSIPENTVTNQVVRPSWVNKRPTNPSYYIGIAMASKSASPTTYQLVAQRNALNELASSIEVKVNSNSMLFTFEESNSTRDEFKEFVQIKTNQKVENFEEVAVWENDYEYWVYYRLAKAQYKKDKQADIDLATNKSRDLVKQGENEWEQGNFRQGMIYFFDALNPIKPYLGEPLPVTLNNSKEVYLGNYILSQISQGVREFQISPVLINVNAIWGGNVSSKDLTFKVSDRKDKAIDLVPVRFTYSEGMIRPREGVSGVKGMVFTEISKLTSTNSIQEVGAEIDFQTMITGDNRPDEIEQLIFHEISTPKTSIKLNVSAPLIYVYSKEQSFGIGKGSSLKSAFKTKSSEMGFGLATSQKQADIVVYIESNTTKAGVNYDLNNVYINGVVKVTDKRSNAIIYQDKITNIKGVSNSFQNASKEAYKKGEEQILKKIVPRFYRKYTNN